MINDITGAIAAFARSNPIIALIALIMLSFLIYRKPIFFLFIFLLGLLLAGVLYVVLNASTSGVVKKERLIQKGAPPRMSSGLRDHCAEKAKGN